MEKCSIPGLVRITEADDGRKFIFDIEDDKVEVFYAHFGLRPGDTDGFQKIVEESINRLIDMHCEKNAPP
jgi:hypothetical protein